MSSKAVNVPVDPKAKERDINTKLQLYGIYQAFANGKVPSNKQIDVALNSFLTSKALNSPSKRLSTEGQALVSDFRNVVEQAKLLILTKNEGNLLQDFIWQTQQINGANAAVPGAPIDKATAQQHGNEALEGLRTLGTLLISNGQFRKLLSDASVLLRDIAGDAAQNTANKVRPSDEQLSSIDRPAEDNTWHEVPDLSKQNLQNQVQARSPFNNKQEAKQDAKGTLGDVTQAAHPTGSRDPADVAHVGAHEAQTGQPTGLNAQAAVGEVKAKVNENVSDEDQNRVREQRARLNNYLKGKMPEERRDQTIWRLKKMVVEIQGHQDYARAIETLIRLAEEYAGHGRNVASQSKGTVADAHNDSALQLAEADLKTLLERFANSTSSEDLVDSINQIYRDADNDPQLKEWFRRLDTYIRKILQQQGFILEDASTEEWNRIYDDGHALLRGRYRGHTDRIADEFKFAGQQFDADPQNKAFADSLVKLFNDLGQDENGKSTFKPHLVKDLTDVILPAVFENIRYVPIPRIEYSDPQIDAIVENLVIEGDNLAPNSLEFGSDNYWRWGRKHIKSKNKNKILLSVSGVQMDLRDVSYYVKRKQGFPGITDKGVMDIFMGGSGFSFKVEAETADPSDKLHYFKINKVSTDIQNLSIKVKKSNHKLLFSLFKPLVLKVLRPVIQRVLEKQIKDSVHQLDGILYEVKKEADRAAEEAKRNPDPENVQNIYQRYVAAANQQILRGKQKKAELQEKTKDTKVNVAVTQHDSIFKNISLPGGISSKATEYKELGAKGDKWESPVFSIGSGKESTSVPKVASITRKPHGRTGGYGTPSTGTGVGAGTGVGTGAGYTGAGNTGIGGTTAGSGYGSQTGTGYGSQTEAGYGSQAGTGYGTQTGAGYGAQTGAGYGAQTGTGYGSQTGTGYGSQPGAAGTTGTSGATGAGFGQGPTGGANYGQGLAHQLDGAFATPANGGVSNPAGGLTGTTGTTGTAAPTDTKYNTSLGDQNPVYRGNA